MSNVWFTSDPHFGHDLVAGLRGFGSTAEHDDRLVANFNRFVSPGDEVWWLGDLTLSSPEYALSRIEEIPGRHHLIAGNHDACHPMHRKAHRTLPRYLEVFESVQAFARRRVAGTSVLLSHFPYPGPGGDRGDLRYEQYRLPDLGEWLLHGHLHLGLRQVGRQIHVGLDAWDLRPVPLSRIADFITADEDAPA